MRVFLDTNILVSAILFPSGRVAGFLKTAIAEHTLVVSSFVVDELHKVFNAKFSDKKAELERFLTEFGYELVYSPKAINSADYPKVRDENDLPIIVAAVVSDCDYLVTGDKDILEVQLERPRIITAQEFEELSARSEL